MLGPNGAGKTTTVHMLTTMLTPDAGEVEVGGHDLRTDPEGIRAAIGVTGQFSAVDNLLTGQENLQLMADLNHLPRDEGRRRIADLLDRFDLVEVAGRMVATYSGGEKRRLDLAMTLVGDPRIVFLDEPTTGLDPRGRRTMWDIVRALVRDGITIFLTTQYLEEADELAGRIALLDDGQIVAQGTPAELKRLVPGGHIRLEFGDPAQLERAAERLSDARRDPDALALDIPTDGEVASLRAVLDRLDGHLGRGSRRLAPQPGPRRRLPLPHRQELPTKGGDPMTFVLQDTATMLRRNLLHARRYPSLTLLVAAIPVIFYLIFVFVFGSTLGDGLPGAVGGRDEYIAYLTPGILIVTVANGISSMAIVIAMDKHEGIVLRFRTMSIPRAAVLAGHVVNGVLQTMFSIVLVIGVAVLTGFRPTTSPLEIAGAIGMLAIASFAFSWLAVPMGLVSNSVETASNLPLPILLLPFFGSAFVPPESMPWPISWFAEYQPFTPMIETVRGLLLGTPIGWSGVIALGWCAAITWSVSGAPCASTTATPSRPEQ